jgi:putative DNA primase/helicase
MLQPFGVVPNTMRIGAETAKGYRLDCFKDAFSRYLPLSNPSHRHKPAPSRLVTDKQKVTWGSVLQVANPSQPSTGAACDGVTHSDPQNSVLVGNAEAF